MHTAQHSIDTRTQLVVAAFLALCFAIAPRFVDAWGFVFLIVYTLGVPVVVTLVVLVRSLWRIAKHRNWNRDAKRVALFYVVITLASCALFYFKDALPIPVRTMEFSDGAWEPEERTMVHRTVYLLHELAFYFYPLACAAHCFWIYLKKDEPLLLLAIRFFYIALLALAACYVYFCSV
ncbi:MAG: hypothetical protein EOP50_07700 [Sphingobacteriales bacterium]|nr:MAG: hypothetical protein EOP50_07700 [Sphingobacteriales bacterium]